MKKKLLAVFLTLAMMLSLMPTALAADVVEVSTKAELDTAINAARDGDTIKLKGEKVEIKTVQDALKLKIGYVPEDRLREGLFLTRSLSDNLVAASVDDMADGIRLDYKKVDDSGRQWVEDLKIVIGDIQDPASSLSGGNQQRIVLAKWLATNPQLLILNCPTVGVDVGSKSQIHEIVKDLARQGIGVIVISDDIGEVMSLCSRVLVMKKGRIVSETDRTKMTVPELEEYLTKEE